MRKEGRDCDCDKRFRKYLLSSVIHIFRNGQSSHGRGDKCFEVTTSTLLIGTLGSVISMLATLCHGNTDRNRITYQLRDIYSINRCCWTITLD
jgi:hypothetical protein